MRKKKILNIVGARPNFVKMAPLIAELRNHAEIDAVLVHTGQHYGESMDRLFFDQLGIPTPEVNLGVGSASQAVQTARIMERFEPVLAQHSPDLVLVVGDVNSTLACALVAAKARIPVCHVEAGLRSFDRAMPEEINRVLTDAIADYLFVTEKSGVQNLLREGVAEEKIFLVGNLMIDTLIRQLPNIARSPILQRLGLRDRAYAVATLHRPSNVDNPENLRALFEMLTAMAHTIPLVLPAHPRTVKNLNALGVPIDSMLHGSTAGGTPERGLVLIEPLGYFDFLSLVKSARLVLTDSGGIQEETTFLKVPCLTLRENTERPITVEIGTNRLVGANPRSILEAFAQVMAHPISPDSMGVPELWDGRAAERIVAILLGKLFADRVYDQADAPALV